HLAGADDLLDADRFQELDQGVDLVLGASHLDDVGPARHVDDLPAEDVDDVDDLAARAFVDTHLEQDELALHVGGVGEVDDADDADQLVELLLDLLERLVVAAGDQGDARHRRVHRLRHREALDVEAAAAEKPGDPSEDSELVLDQDGDGVTHPLVRAVPREDLHDLVLARELQLLETLLLHLFLGGEVVLLLKRLELLLEVVVLVVVVPQLRLTLEQGGDQLLVLSLHSKPPPASSLATVIRRKTDCQRAGAAEAGRASSASGGRT